MIVTVKLEGAATKPISHERPSSTPTNAGFPLSLVLRFRTGLEDLGDFWEGYEGDEGEEQQEARRDDSPLSHLGQLVLTNHKQRKRKQRKPRMTGKQNGRCKEFPTVTTLSGFRINLSHFSFRCTDGCSVLFWEGGGGKHRVENGSTDWTSHTLGKSPHKRRHRCWHAISSAPP